MTSENVEQVRRDIAARDARDWTKLADVWHADIELRVIGGGAFRGLDEITAFFDTFSDLHTDYRVEAIEVVEAGDHVVTVERIAGRGLKGSEAGGWIAEILFRVIEFREGRIWRVTEYPSRRKAFEAVQRIN